MDARARARVHVLRRHFARKLPNDHWESDCVAKYTDGSSVMLVGVPAVGTVIAYQAVLHPGAHKSGGVRALPEVRLCIKQLVLDAQKHGG